MAIFRGVGGSGDSTDNSYLEELTAIALEVEQDKVAAQNATLFATQAASSANSSAVNAEASATSAANSLASIINTEITSASFNTSDGVLTLTKTGGATVTADLDGRFLTSYTETDPVFNAHVASSIAGTDIFRWNTAYSEKINSVNFSGSTLTLTRQDGSTLTTTINSGLGTELSFNGNTKIEAVSGGVEVTGDIVVSGTVDGRDLTTDGNKLDAIASGATANDTDANLKARANHTGTQAISTVTGLQTALDGKVNTVAGKELSTNDFTDADHTKLDGIEALADVTDATNVASAGAAMLTETSSSIFQGSIAIGSLLSPKNLEVFGNSSHLSGITVVNGADISGTVEADNLDISTSGTVTTNIATGVNTSSADTKTVNIGSGFANGGYTNINIGSGGATTCTTTVNNDFNVDGTAYLNNHVEFKSDVSTVSIYDSLVTFKAKTGTSTWGEAGRIAVKGFSSAPANFVIGIDSAALRYFDGFGQRNITPANVDTANGTDAICDLGTYYNRFRIGKFSSGTSTTSDGREKRNIEELNEAELRVATRCKSLLRKYQRTEALELKGDDARLHFGIIAQDLEQAFADEGLDAHRYAMFLEDTWYVTEEDGETFPVLEAVPEELRESAVQKSLKGIRYEQLLAFIIAAI